MCGDVTSTGCFVATDLVIILNWEWQTVWCRLAALTFCSRTSVPHPLLLSCTLIYLKMMSNKQRVAEFLILRDWKCPARVDRMQSWENRKIFSYAIDALDPWRSYKEDSLEIAGAYALPVTQPTVSKHKRNQRTLLIIVCKLLLFILLSGGQSLLCWSAASCYVYAAWKARGN